MKKLFSIALVSLFLALPILTDAASAQSGVVAQEAPSKVAEPPAQFVKAMAGRCAAAYGDRADFVRYDVETHACELTYVSPIARVVTIPLGPGIGSN